MSIVDVSLLAVVTSLVVTVTSLVVTVTSLVVVKVVTVTSLSSEERERQTFLLSVEWERNYSVLLTALSPFALRARASPLKGGALARSANGVHSLV